MDGEGVLTAAPGVIAIDLEHNGLPGAISTYLLTEPEPALVDPGPSTTLEALEHGLERAALRVTELRHLLLTHVHLDHAGVCGQLAAANPRLRVHVHEEGARHLVDPERLVASTRRVFGEDHDRLWGEVRAVPAERIAPVELGRGAPLRAVRAIPTPGHIAHHLAYLHESSGTLFTGDALGIIVASGAPTHPPTPPPSFDPEAWRRTLEELRALNPERFAVAHFGVHSEFEARRVELLERLDALVARVSRALEGGRLDDAERYEAEVRETLARYVDRERVDRYFDTFRARTDWEGVRFYLERRG